MEIGAQLFTVREACKNLDDFAESLKKVADIGYKTVQVSGTCDYEPQWLAEQLKKNDLRCVLTHIPADRLKTNAAEIAKNHSIFGCDYVGLGWHNFDKNCLQETYDTFVEDYRPVAKAIKENGRYFMFHNHHREFQKLNGTVILEKLAQDFPVDEMGFTLDTYWVQVGGGDPAQWIDKLAGRLPCIHLKDCGYEQRMDVIGEGNINFDRVFERAEAAGVKYMLVEQDNCNGEDPFECLKRSYAYLHACGF